MSQVERKYWVWDGHYAVACSLLSILTFKKSCYRIFCCMILGSTKLMKPCNRWWSSLLLYATLVSGLFQTMGTSRLTSRNFFLMEIPYGGLNHELILISLSKSDSNLSAYTHRDKLSLPHTQSQYTPTHWQVCQNLCWPFFPLAGPFFLNHLSYVIIDFLISCSLFNVVVETPADIYLQFPAFCTFQIVFLHFVLFGFCGRHMQQLYNLVCQILYHFVVLRQNIVSSYSK